MHSRLTPAPAKITCSHKRGMGGRGLHAEMQLKVCTLLHLMQRGEGSEVESFHANKSLFSFIRSPKLNEEGRVASPSSPPLVRYCSVTDNSSAALCSSQMTTMTWPLQGAPSPALRPFLLLCAIGHETNTQRPLNGVHFAASTTRFPPLNRFEGAIEMSSFFGPPPMPQRRPP